MKPNICILFLAQTKTPPARRGCFGLGIVPTGELEGRQDLGVQFDGAAQLYQLGNWKAGKTSRSLSSRR